MLDVLDGAVLVVSAVEGVQAQTRILLRTLRRLRIPTLIFANKVDRSGARDGTLLADLRARLSPDVVALSTVSGGLGTRAAAVRPLGPDDVEHVEELTEFLASRDDGLLARYVADQPVPYAELRRRLAGRTRRAEAYPVFFGSAITGAGTDLLTAALPDLLPPSSGDAEGPLTGRVFKIDRGPGGQKQAYARLFSGTLRTRDRVVFGARPGGGAGHRHPGLRPRHRRAAATRSGPARSPGCPGLVRVRIGDALGDGEPARPSTAFAPPTLETVVTPEDPAARGALYAALSLLAEQDPLINLRTDPETGEVALSLYGEVQKEVIAATLADDFGVRARFTETTVLHVERPLGAGVGAAGRRHRRPTRSWPPSGLRVEPGPPGSGIAYAVAGDKSGHAAAGVLHRGRGVGVRGRCSTAASAGRSSTAASP